MSQRKSLVPLLAGICLVVLGILLLVAHRMELHPGLLPVARLLISALVLLLGVRKLVRHYSWDAVRLQDRPRRSSLLGGLVLGTLGGLLLADQLMDIDAWALFGDYWPLLLIAFGLGKIIDYYRLEGRLQFRAREAVGVALLILLGLTFSRLAGASFRFVDIDLPWLLEQGIRSKYNWEVNRRIERGEARLLEISNLYGNVRVDASPTQAIEVRLSKVVFQKSERRARKIADQIRILSEREGTALRLSTNRDQLEHRLKFNTHLVVRVPEQMDVTVHNAWGDVHLSRLQGDCRVENAYGEVRADFLGGNLQVKNKYKPVSVTHVQGNVSIHNRRGSVRVGQIEGQVKLETDYKAVEVDEVEGDLEVRNRYGSVRASDVSGSVTIVAPGSRVVLSDAGKEVKIENSHKPVTLTDLSADLQLETSYSQVSLKEIRGNVRVQAADATLRGESLYQDVEIQARSSRLDLTDLGGRLDLATSLRSVVLRRFQGKTEVKNEYGAIQLYPEGPLGGSLTASNRNGEIRLTLPSDASFHLSAQAVSGRVISDFGKREKAGSRDLQLLEFTSGSGRPQVRLRTSYASIVIRRR